MNSYIDLAVYQIVLSFLFEYIFYFFCTVLISYPFQYYFLKILYIFSLLNNVIFYQSIYNWNILRYNIYILIFYINLQNFAILFLLNYFYCMHRNIFLFTKTFPFLSPSKTKNFILSIFNTIKTTSKLVFWTLSRRSITYLFPKREYWIFDMALQL